MAAVVTTGVIDLNSGGVVPLISDVLTLEDYGYVLVAAETGTIDDLSTIDYIIGLGISRAIVVLQADTGDTITIKHDVDNISFNNGTDFVLSGNKVLLLFLNGTIWSDVGDSDAVAVSADDVSVNKIGAATYDNVQDNIDLVGSAGWISGGEITDNLDGTVDVAAGTGLIRDANTNTSNLLFFDWDASADVALVDNSDNYIYLDYNGGSPQIATTTTGATVRDNENTLFELTEIHRYGTDLHITSHKQIAGNALRLILQRDYAIFGIRRADNEGGLILGETGTRNITMTGGALYIKLDRSNITAIDTSGTDTFDRYYLLNGVWTKQISQTQWNNTQYNNVSILGSEVLATLDNNKFASQYFYIEPDNHLVAVYGQAQYVSLAGAEAESPPASIPNVLEEHALLIGRIVFQKSDTTAQSVQSNFTTVFNPSAAADHGNLAGLSDDDHTQYLLADGTRALTGDWDAGAFKITAEQLESDIATGTPPLVIASTTAVPNLNADLLDDEEGTYYLALANATGILPLDNGGTEADLGATGPGEVIQASAGAAFSLLKHDLAASASPTVDDDSGEGYAIGSLIVTTIGNIYRATDVSVGAAKWERLNGADGYGNILKDTIDYQWAITTIDSTTLPPNDNFTPVFGRYVLLSDGDDVVDITRENTFLPTSGSQYYAELTITAAGANKKFGLMSVLSADNSIPLRDTITSLQMKLRTVLGSQVTWMRYAILEWSGTADEWTDPIASWNAAGTDPTLTANWAYAGGASSGNLGPDGYVDIWVTEAFENVTLGSGFNNVAVVFFLDDTNKGAGALIQLTQAQLEIGSVATEFVPLVREDFPNRATMWHDEAVIISGSGLDFTLTAAQKYVAYIFQSTQVNGNKFSQSFFMKAGIYTFTVLGVDNTNRGKIDWSIDDTDIIIGQDWYNTTIAYNVEKTNSFPILFDGLHVLKGTTNGKNASSSGYSMVLTKYWIN